MSGEETEKTVRIDALAYGPAAVARDRGKVGFVSDTAPGDLVRVRVRADRGSYFLADLLEILEASPARATPPCPLAGTCGGCNWQHVVYHEQLHAKQRAVADALTRIGGIADPAVADVVPSPHEFGYRNRLKLRFEKGRLGFYRSESHALVAIDDCLIADDRVRAAIAPAEELARSLTTRVTRVEIASRERLSGVVVAINAYGRLRRADVHAVRVFLTRRDHTIRGVVMWGRGWRRAWGDVRRRLPTAEGLTIEICGGSFGQVHTEGSVRIAEDVVAAVRASEARRVLDLYAGAGNFTLPIARHVARVDAVERDPAAAAAGLASARHHGLHNVEFFPQSVESFLERRKDDAGYEFLVLNPPRSGVAQSCRPIAELGIPRIAYVSCNPATLARDVRVFTTNGYRLRSTRPYDLFPHTYHVETVCELELT